VALRLENLATQTLLDAAAAGEAAVFAEQAEALLTLAARLSPEDSRLARELVEVRLETAGADAALEALDYYRGLEPEDRLAQLRYVDLSADLLETAELKLAYLTQVVEAERVPAEVRSHAAVLAAFLLRERLETESAAAMIARAVELDPLNPQALTLDYERLLAEGAGRPERVGALGRLLASNVAQPAALSQLARELGAVGLVEEAIRFYTAASQIDRMSGQAPPPRQGLDQAALLLVNARPRRALELLALPEDPEVILQADAGVLGDLVLLQGLSRQTLRAGDDEIAQAATPLDTVLRDLGNGDGLPASVAAAAVASDVFPDRVRALLTLADRAWFDLAVLGRATDPALLDAVERVADSVGEGGPLVARLRGWQAVRQGDEATAREKLGAIAGTDPLAELGLLVLARDAGRDTFADATRLLRENPSGVVGATIYAAYAREGIRVGNPARADEVEAALDETFPRRLLGLLEPAGARNFYAVTAEPDRVRHAVGEPLLGTLTIRNVGRDPLTLGPGGLIDPRVRIEGEFRGLLERPRDVLSSVTITGRTRLDPGERVEQAIRVDSPALAGLLRQTVPLSTTLYPFAVTNPIVVDVPDPQTPGQVRPIPVSGPAGQNVPFLRPFDRPGLPLDLEDEGIRTELAARLSALRDNPNPADRIRAADQVAAQLDWLRLFVANETDAGRDVRAWTTMGADVVTRLREAALAGSLAGDDAAATAYLRYLAARSPEIADDRVALIRPMLRSPSLAARALGVLSVVQTLPEQADELLSPLAEADPDPTIRRYAASALAFTEARVRLLGEAPAGAGDASE
jgi:hypothetical protein